MRPYVDRNLSNTVTVIETYNLGELGAVSCLVLDDLAPDFDLAEQKRSVRSLSVAVVPSRTKAFRAFPECSRSPICNGLHLEKNRCREFSHYRMLADQGTRRNPARKRYAGGRRLCGTSLPQ